MKKHGYVEGSGNIFADLGVANPEEARALQSIKPATTERLITTS